MADSSYYYRMYKQKKQDEKEYAGQIKDLEKIRDNLTDDMYDEIRKVNNEIDALVEDLKDGVRHVSSYTNRANELKQEKEKAVTADQYLSVAVRELNDEISSLSGKRSQAERERDEYYRKYKEKKDQENKEFWDKIF